MYVQHRRPGRIRRTILDWDKLNGYKVPCAYLVSASFQRLVELAMRGLIKGIFYIYQLLINSKSHAE
jgi:hypothetical protein